jgi:hypothetical protein
MVAEGYRQRRFWLHLAQGVLRKNRLLALSHTQTVEATAAGLRSMASRLLSLDREAKLRTAKDEQDAKLRQRERTNLLLRALNKWKDRAAILQRTNQVMMQMLHDSVGTWMVTLQQMSARPIKAWCHSLVREDKRNQSLDFVPASSPKPLESRNEGLPDHIDIEDAAIAPPVVVVPPLPYQSWRTFVRPEIPQNALVAPDGSELFGRDFAPDFSFVIDSVAAVLVAPFKSISVCNIPTGLGLGPVVIEPMIKARLPEWTAVMPGKPISGVADCYVPAVSIDLHAIVPGRPVILAEKTEVPGKKTEEPIQVAAGTLPPFLMELRVEVEGFRKFAEFKAIETISSNLFKLNSNNFHHHIPDDHLVVGVEDSTIYERLCISHINHGFVSHISELFDGLTLIFIEIVEPSAF